MPTSIDPQPGEDEIECARCGAVFFHQLTHCPNCGVNLYEPEGEDQPRPSQHTASQHNGIASRIRSLLTGKPPQTNLQRDIEQSAQVQAGLYEQLLLRVGGDPDVAGRLIDFEARRLPDKNRTTWLESAIHRWDRDNS